MGAISTICSILTVYMTLNFFKISRTILAGIITLIAVSVFAQTTPVNTTGVLFMTNLRQGDRSEDIRTLQRVLNASDETRLVDTGPGSPGQETDYFGALTLNAVVKFQEKFADAILTPIQLTQGTGFVGPMTRKKLNEAAVVAGITTGGQEAGSSSSSAGSSGLSSTGSSSGSSGSSTAVKPKIITISPSSGLNGTDITITGEGFTSTDNTIRSTLITTNNLSSKDGKTIEFKFYSDVVNNMLGIDAMKQEGVTLEDFLADLSDIQIAHPESVFPVGKSRLIPVFITISNKNGISNQVEFSLDMDPTHYFGTSTPAASLNTQKQFSILQKVTAFISNIVAINIAEARRRGPSQYDLAKQSADRQWSSFMGSAGGGMGPGPAFGGNVIMSIPCVCSASTAFTIKPVAGPAGPYNASWYSTAIKSNYSLFIPFNAGYWVLGSAASQGSGVCSIWVVVACFNYNATEILPTPGVGSSLTV